jgi:hypothetical protein
VWAEWADEPRAGWGGWKISILLLFRSFIVLIIQALCDDSIFVHDTRHTDRPGGGKAPALPRQEINCCLLLIGKLISDCRVERRQEANCGY